MKLPVHLQSTRALIVAAIVTTGIIVGILFLARGWLRGPAISWLVTQVYAPKIEQVFERDVAPINDQLAKRGIHFKRNEFQPGKARCFDANFKFIHETLYCGRWQYSEQTKLTPDFAASWPEESAKIKTLLKDHGWTFEQHRPYTRYVADDDLSKLLDETDGGNASYIKRDGEVTCSLTFYYNPSLPHIPESFIVQESCTRPSVQLFGGYRY